MTIAMQFLSWHNLPILSLYCFLPRWFLNTVFCRPEAKPATGASHIVWIGFNCDPSSLKCFCSRAGRVAPREWVEDEVTRLCKEPNEEICDLHRHPCGVRW